VVELPDQPTVSGGDVVGTCRRNITATQHCGSFAGKDWRCCRWSSALGGAAQADDNAAPGAGNALAIEISSKSALASSAKAFIDLHIGEIRDDKLRTATADAIDNPGTCIRHRAGLDSITEARIIEMIKAEGLVDPEDDKRSRAA
jgi:hypothetical protein